MTDVATTCLHAGYVASRLPAWLRFRQALRRPELAQLSRLKALLAATAPSAYGQHLGLGSVDSLRAFQRRVPLVDYDALRPWIERICRGEPRVLTVEPVQAMERTSGSTAGNKLIPLTGGFLAEVDAATAPWLCDLHLSAPGLIGTRSYWSVSPATRQRETTEGGVPIGLESDAEYFGPWSRWALRRLMAVPETLARVTDMGAWRWETCRSLLACRDLGLISVWSPSFIALLMEHIEANVDSLLAALANGRRSEIGRRLDAAGQVTGEALWPRLRLISCWTEGASQGLMRTLRRWFPSTAIQPKGLMATEGVVSVPLWGQRGAPAAVLGHFMEFVDLAGEGSQRPPLLAHQLRVDGSYSPVLTTGAGLVRYHLKDVVRCVGHVGGAPLLTFEGRLDGTSDLCGEKLCCRVVEAGLDRVCHSTGLSYDFALVAPDAQRSRYTLYLESSSADAVVRSAAGKLEQELRRAHHYDYCRKLGQLEPLRVVRVRRGWHTYVRVLAERGLRLGDIKPAVLDARRIWDGVFAPDAATRPGSVARLTAARGRPGGSERLGPDGVRRCGSGMG